MLKKIKPQSLDVLSTFLERKQALPIYSKIINKISDTLIYKTTETETKNRGNNLYCIYDFPGYFKGFITKKGWKLKSINTYKGSLIILKNYKNTEDYLKAKFSSGRRSKFRTYQNRLETCFNIEYKTYYGNISKEEYERLFKVFHELTRKRFLEKKIQNYDLSRWDIYHEIAYPQINSKNAVLFVIFNNNVPISLCLNFVRGNTIYGYLRTYDIDYSKFYIGFTDFIKQLQWCYDNNIEFFDLLKGSYPYKLRLIDTQYNFQKHVLYNSASMGSTILAKIIIAKTQAFYLLVKCLKNLNFNVLYYKFLNYKYRNKELKKHDNDSLNIVVNKITAPPNELLQPVDLNDESLHFLKKPVYTILYTNKESINAIKLFKFKNEANAYLLKGEKTVQKITLKLTK